MRLLLDECLPRKLRRHFAPHDARTVAQMGWGGKQNGELMSLMLSNGFEVFVTADRNLRHQQNVSTAGIVVVVLAASTNKLADLLPLAPGAMSAIASIKIGDVIEIR